MSELTQDKRIGTFTTPLGKDVLVLTRFDGSEGLSELFDYRIEALSKREDINFDPAIGQKCSLSLKTYGAERAFNGVLVEAQWLGPRGPFYAYRLVLRPELWLLSRKTDCRIFSNTTAPDILKKVLEGLDVAFKLSGKFPQLEYYVQYRETDLAFASRLMEQHGIYYYFEHSVGSHKLCLINRASSHTTIPSLKTVPYIRLSGDDRRDQEHIYQWSSERKFRTCKVELNDYDYKEPGKKLLQDANASEGYNPKTQFYDHPGKYTKPDDGDFYAKIRLEAEQALDHRRHASGDAVSLYPGGLTALQRHPTGSENQTYLVVRASHSFVTEHYRSGGDHHYSDQIYQGSYEVLKSDQQFRAPIVTPKPQVLGMHTAVVVGKSGEEIDTDKYGRVRVEFFWDREKNFSRWARVAHVWAYKSWGAQFIPRVGMEVIVIYEEGDPDYPLIIGAVYNGDNEHPYTLPDNKTQSGVKSNSSKGGHGYNEFMFEDKKGGEFIRMHAEKDHLVTILNKETTEIGERFMPPKGSPSRDTTLKKGDDNLTLLMGDQNITINMGDQNIVIALGNQTTFVMQNITTASTLSNTTTVIASSVAMSPASISLTSPTINLTAAASINITAPIINITGIVNLTGVLNITGGILVNGMVPMLLPA